MTPNDSAIPIDQCVIQPSLEKLPSAADRNKHRDLQSDRTQRDLGTLSSKWDVFIKFLHSDLRLPLVSGGRMSVKS